MSRPWMPLYIADYRADTMRLSTIEHGAYLLLIMEYWRADGLPDDDKQLSRIAGLSVSQWKKMRPVIQAFFHDGWRHKRIDEELAHTVEVSAKRKAAVEQREKKRRSNDTSNYTSNTVSNDDTSHTSQSKKEEDTSLRSDSGGKYYFESGVIRLAKKDFEKWRDAYQHLDLKAELLSLTQWAGEQENWFFAIAGALAKRNREQKLKLAHAQTPQGKREHEDFTDPEWRKRHRLDGII